MNSFSLDKWIYLSRMCEDNLTAIGIYSVPDLVLLKASQKYVDYWGNPFNVIEYCLGKRVYELIPDWHGSVMEIYWKDVLLTGKTLQLKEFMYHEGPRGVTYWDMTVTPLYEDGSIKYLVSNSIDVTDRVLDRIRIENQSKLISKQNEMLGKSLIEQEEFFSNISHELKTPLNVILSALQVLDLYCPNRCPDNKSTKYRRIMKQNCFRLLRLINNLIDVSKIDTGFISLEIDNHNIVSVVEDITLSVADFIENKGLNLIFDTDTEEKIIACDPDKIERIILNLLSNSIKFTNAGGEIRVNILDKGEYVNIVVEDTGIGIPEDKLNLIFQRFKQVDKSLKRTHEGSGIGLSLVKSLVELHQGTIEVSSQLGVGSSFSIMLHAKTINSCSIKPQEMISQNNIERITIEFSDIYALGE